MAESPAADIALVAETLDELNQLVSTNSVQPVNQFAEHAVVYWLRIVEGTDVLLPRLNENGYVPDAFHFGLEKHPENRMDMQTPVLGLGQTREIFSQRLSALGAKLEDYLAQSGYRSSSENCDQIMLEVNHFSRFLSCCCLEAEQAVLSPPRDGALDTSGKENDIRRMLDYTRDNLFVWEPTLNDVIVCWEQNALSEFDRALRELAALAGLPEQERTAHRMPPGFPLRPRGRPRSKVTVVNPVLRPLRTRPMFLVRFGQLVRRLEEIGKFPQEVLEGLVQEIRYFITMIRNNHFMLASEPSFWEKYRPGMPLIRGRPNSHPFLHDPMDFFKKAVLFHNRTYTVAGGGVDLFYLQVKQLERYYKFHSPTGTRNIRIQLDNCLRGWEENRWDAFTEGLLQLAEWMRARAEA